MRDFPHIAATNSPFEDRALSICNVEIQRNPLQWLAFTVCLKLSDQPQVSCNRANNATYECAHTGLQSRTGREFYANVRWHTRQGH